MDIDKLLNNELARVPFTREDLIADLCSITVAIPASIPDPFPVLCSLEFGTLKETLMGKTYEVGIIGATLRLQPIGYNINKAGKFGSIKVLEQVAISYAEAKESQNLSGTKLAIKSCLNSEFGINDQQSETYTSNYSYSYNHHYVKATSNNCWSIRRADIKDKFLEGDYLGGSIICYLSPVGSANLKSLNASLEVTPSQIAIVSESDSKKFGIKLKHSKLVQALVAKRVRNTIKLSKKIEKNTSIINMSIVEIADDIS